MCQNLFFHPAVYRLHLVLKMQQMKDIEGLTNYLQAQDACIVKFNCFAYKLFPKTPTQEFWRHSIIQIWMLQCIFHS